jgi:hypothetical protein
LVGEEQLERQLVVYYEVIARAYLGIYEVEKAREYASVAEDA